MRPLGSIKPIITCCHCKKGKLRKSYHQRQAPTGTAYVIQPCKECKAVYDSKRVGRRRELRKEKRETRAAVSTNFNQMMAAFRPERES